MSPDLVGDGDIEITRAQNRNYALADGFHRMAKQNNSFGLFLRYRRAEEEFTRLKALRSELRKEPILEPNPKKTNQIPPHAMNPFRLPKKPQA